MKIRFAIPIALLLAACQPSIGDSCITDAECGRNQVCDSTMPGGYCLEFDCDLDTCPPEAVCVGFVQDGEVLINACMERCSGDSDCRTRDGYVCRDDMGSIPFCGIAPLEPNEGSGQ
jgi:hypothetical protein